MSHRDILAARYAALFSDVFHATIGRCEDRVARIAPDVHATVGAGSRFTLTVTKVAKARNHTCT